MNSDDSSLEQLLLNARNASSDIEEEEEEAADGDDDSAAHSAYSLEERRQMRHKRNHDDISRDSLCERSNSPVLQRQRVIEEDDADDDDDDATAVSLARSVSINAAAAAAAADDSSTSFSIWSCNRALHNVRDTDALPIKKESYHGGNRKLEPFKSTRMYNADTVLAAAAAGDMELLDNDENMDCDEFDGEIECTLDAFPDEFNVPRAMLERRGAAAAAGQPPPLHYAQWLRTRHGQQPSELYTMDPRDCRVIHESLKEHLQSGRAILCIAAQRIVAKYDHDYDHVLFRRCDELYRCFYLCFDGLMQVLRYNALSAPCPMPGALNMPIPLSLREAVNGDGGGGGGGGGGVDDAEEMEYVVARAKNGEEKVNELIVLKNQLRGVVCSKRLRRVGSAVYKPVHNERGEFCWAYEEALPVDEWVFTTVKYELGIAGLSMLEGKAGVAERVRDFFRPPRTGFDDLEVTRHMMSFRNGVYFVQRAEFVPHSMMSDRLLLAPNVYACVYHDRDFPVEYMHLRNVELPLPAPFYEGQTRPDRTDTVYDLPTPALDKMLLDQGWSYAVRVAMYVMIGRTLYDQDYLDSEQLALFCTGMPKTGKSTIVHTILKFYPSHLTCSLAGQAERTFGLESTLDSFLVAHPEVVKSWSMDPSDFLKMVAGDRVSFARKFKTALTMDFRAGFIASGNQLPGWNDDDSSIARRLMIWQFNKIITMDPMQQRRLEQELPAIIHKCNRYYLAAARLWHDRQFEWPEYFEMTRQRYRLGASPIFKFLMTSNDLVKEPQYRVPFHELMRVFSLFMTKNKREFWGSSVRTELGTWMKPCLDVGLQVTEEMETHNYHGTDIEDYYVLGVDLRERHESVMNE